MISLILFALFQYLSYFGITFANQFIKLKSTIMKAIRNMAFTALLTIGTFSLITYTSCNKDECKDVVCQNGGTCNADTGNCECATGYEGDLCETKVSTKFVGTWLATETCGSTQHSPYEVYIVADPSNPSKIQITNLGNYNCALPDNPSGTNITFNADIKNGTELSIIDVQCKTEMTAQGAYNNGTITIKYTAKYDLDKVDVCEVTLTKN